MKQVMMTAGLGLFLWTLGCNKVAEPNGSGGQGESGSANAGSSSDGDGGTPGTGASSGSGDGDGGTASNQGGNGGGGPTGSGGEEGEPDCYEDPTTHYEIINACTTATRVEKHPDLDGLNEDGSLPDL